MSGELTVQTQQSVERAQPVENVSMIHAIQRAASDPNTDTGKMRELLAMVRELESDRRMVAFTEALARVQERAPRITKNGRISFSSAKGSQNTPYALLEDIDRAIRPLLSEEGFAVSWDTTPADGKIRVIGKLSHRAGHSETKQIDLPADTSGSKNPVQAVGSTVSYGRRHVMKMFFNLIETEEDDDGNLGRTDPPISVEEARTINDKLAEVGANLEAFKRHFHVEKLADLRESQMPAVHNAIETKRKGIR